MSLFLCEECGTIENTATCSRNNGTRIDKPNLYLLEMHGHGSELYLLGSKDLLTYFLDNYGKTDKGE